VKRKHIKFTSYYLPVPHVAFWLMGKRGIKSPWQGEPIFARQMIVAKHRVKI